jgi:outer membrane protein
MLTPLTKSNFKNLRRALASLGLNAVNSGVKSRSDSRIALFLALTLSLTLSAHAQGALDGYIREGLSSNLVLKERQLGLQRGLLGLQNAKRLFLPSVNFAGTYTLAHGGRNIPLPLGDLMNPVYSTLNALTQSNSFPQIENTSVQFLPNNFYDVKVRTTVPIVNSDLLHNRKIQDQMIEMKETEVEVYKLELIKEIRVAYFHYLMALEAKGIYISAQQLVEQNQRVNKSLLDNGKGLPAQVMRAESELEQVKAQLIQAQMDADNARAYFNFLLNRPNESEVIAETMALPADLAALLEDENQAGKRPELTQLDLAMKANDEATLMERQYWVPRLGAFLDLGSQGFNFAVDKNTAYVMAGLQVDIPIWNGGRDQTDIALRQQTQRELENKLQQATQGIQLAAYAKRNTTLAAYESWKSTQRQVDAAEAYFRLVDKGYVQGSFSMIEHVDARNQVTQANLLRNIRKYETLIGWAEYRREIAQSFE